MLIRCGVIWHYVCELSGEQLLPTCFFLSFTGAPQIDGSLHGGIECSDLCVSWIKDLLQTRIFMMTSFCLGMAGTLNFCEKSQLFYHRIIT
jgi:hypothetical protein